ncbi:hypothetical protein K435DRAFT_803013 [Dendrothele bispora CBS 962.96]|uniref:Uncharacterized protein n=1 Tax=Dendrothele bispora (strain CBS 962.96) TaxID=1314807 RepID=A0A4S8LIW9_DENBC|nr:hypothetical protein K435DRAFT_803013 [Dendrothele bispora CBS 962.96]
MSSDAESSTIGVYVGTYISAVIAIAKPDQVVSGGVYWAVSVSWLLEAMIEGIVRMFYCFRVWRVSGNKKLVSAIVFLGYLYGPNKSIPGLPIKMSVHFDL